ncbi:unnamed protein product [Echinostoma caproni]|uniref:Polyprotein n=1 Tax=Echinostoma caproni TaxID=27848 RepID=A0A182ZZF8_9TREM|nr:unnamed protein product [Echinostoma caproni]
MFIPNELLTRLREFIGIDAARKPLQQPYEEPFPVMFLHETFFKVARNGRVDTINIERIKATYADDDLVHTSGRFDVIPARPVIEEPTSELSSQMAAPATISNETIGSGNEKRTLVASRCNDNLGTHLHDRGSFGVQEFVEYDLRFYDRIDGLTSRYVSARFEFSKCS